MKQTPVIILWSGGIESYQTLCEIKKSELYKPVCLLSLIDARTNLLPLTGVKESLLVKQAELLKIPLQRLYLEENNNQKLAQVLDRFIKQGIRTIAINSPLENIISKEKMEILNPLENKKSQEIAQDFLSSGARAVITSILTEKLDNSYLAKEYDSEYLSRLPLEIDPIGRNSEFNSFVYFGEGFKTRVPFSKSIGMIEGDYTVSHLKDA